MNLDPSPTGGLSPELVDQAARGVMKASPGGAVVFVQYVLNFPVEKWVSVAVLIFTVLQIVALARREFFKRSGAAQ